MKYENRASVRSGFIVLNCPFCEKLLLRSHQIDKEQKMIKKTALLTTFILALLLEAPTMTQAANVENSTGKKDVVEKIIKTSSCTNREFNTYNGEILMIESSKLPYANYSKLRKAEYLDDNGIPLHNYNGKLNYHPVFLAQFGLNFIDAYSATRNEKYLQSAKNIAAKLVSISLQINSSIFFPYTFSFPLHGYTEETMVSPWYSGMAQGQALSLFIRIYIITNEKYYLDISNKIVNSFNLSHCNDKSAPWISCVDENGYLWLEEYPHDPPAYTLNGMIFAIYGLYDHYRVTKNLDAEKLLRGAIATIKENIYRFRTENGISQYCLRHPRVKSLSYHKVHIGQLKMLHKITGDNLFLQASIDFTNDTIEPPVSAK